MREFMTMLDMKAPNKFVMRKKRSAFMFKSTYLALDTVKTENLYFSICRIQTLDGNLHVEIPPLIQNNIVTEISDNVNFFSELLAKDLQNERSYSMILLDELKPKLSHFKYI